MVMANPIQLLNVSVDPTNSRGAYSATSAENWGESPTTTTPQITGSPRKITGGALAKKGETRHNIPEHNNIDQATTAPPIRREISPPPAQPKLPAPITTKDQKGTLRSE